MISYDLGVPGSGKTYKAVDIIFNNFSDSKLAIKNQKKNYTNCYTNINGFKFELVNNVYKLDFELLHKCLERLHKHYKAKKDDNYLVKLSKRYKIHNTFFVIDEAHNHFDTQNPVLVWWLTYHRHLFHDIVLITQNLALINAKYKPLAESFYKAVPKTLTLNPFNFTYKMYVDSRMANASFGGKVTLKKRKEVFELYQSGDSVETKNIILKFLIIFVAIFIFLGLIISYVSSKLRHTPSETNQEISIKQNTTTSKNNLVIQQNEIQSQEDKDFKERSYFSLACGINKCSNDDISLPPQLLKKFIEDKSVSVLYVEKINKNLYRYFLDSSTDFYNYLIPQKGVTNDTISNDMPNIGVLPTKPNG